MAAFGGNSGDRDDDGVLIIRVSRKKPFGGLIAKCVKELVSVSRAVKIVAYGAAVQRALELSVRLRDEVDCCDVSSLRTYTYTPSLSLRDPSSSLMEGCEMRQRLLPAVEVVLRIE